MLHLTERCVAKGAESLSEGELQPRAIKLYSQASVRVKKLSRTGAVILHSGRQGSLAGGSAVEVEHGVGDLSSHTFASMPLFKTFPLSLKRGNTLMFCMGWTGAFKM